MGQGCPSHRRFPGFHPKRGARIHSTASLATRRAKKLVFSPLFLGKFRPLRQLQSQFWGFLLISWVFLGGEIVSSAFIFISYFSPRFYHFFLPRHLSRLGGCSPQPGQFPPLPR